MSDQNPEIIIPDIGIEIDHIADFERVFFAKQDSFRGVGENVFMEHCVSIDYAAWFDESLRPQAHRDHKQLIPGTNNQQYAAASIDCAKIIGNTMFSPWSKMQGVFISDGFIRYAEVYQNRIETASDHKISACVMDGQIAGNRDARGNPVEVVLNALRIAGGGLKRPQIKVISFTDALDKFVPAKDIVFDSPYTDNRETIPDNMICLADFDLRGYREAAMKVESHTHENEDDIHGTPRGWEPMCEEFYDLALQYGRQIEKNTGIFV